VICSASRRSSISDTDDRVASFSGGVETHHHWEDVMSKSLIGVDRALHAAVSGKRSGVKLHAFVE
jgi:hypothetical protein